MAGPVRCEPNMGLIEWVGQTWVTSTEFEVSRAHKLERTCNQTKYCWKTRLMAKQIIRWNRSDDWFTSDGRNLDKEEWVGEIQVTRAEFEGSRVNGPEHAININTHVGHIGGKSARRPNQRHKEAEVKTSG
jgi:hypothetical protein